MNSNIFKEKPIWAFSRHLIKKGMYLNPESMADEFLSFFYYRNPPTNHYQIDSFCFEIGIDKVEYKEFPENMRGFHVITPDGKITIILEQSPIYAGKLHTLYHELYEIICELMDKPELKTEFKANLFSASVIMPEKHFFEFVVRRGLMFSEIKVYYPEIANDSILLRINYLFKKRGLFHEAYLLKKIYNCENFSFDNYIPRSEFYLHLSTLAEQHKPNNFYECNQKIFIGKAIDKLFQTYDDSDYKMSLIKFSFNDNVVLVEPILLNKHNIIKEITIQIINKEAYLHLDKLLRRENESSNLCQSIF